MAITYRQRLHLLAAAPIAALVTACSSDKSEPATSGAPAGSSSSAAAEQTGTGKVGGLIAVITPAHSNPFFKAEADAAVAEAKKLGYTAKADSHDDDANKQSQLIDSAISSKAAAIVLDNAGADSTIGAVKKANDAGIPVFLIDREINEAGIAKAQIVANNSQGAALVGTEFAKALEGKGTYIELKGRETDTNAAVRSQAFHSVLDQYPDLKMVGSDTANWDQQQAFTKTETLLQRFPDVTGIICGNDTMALGAVAAVAAANKTGKITVAGFDGSPDAVAAIKAGKLLCTGMQPAVLISQLAVQQADKFIRTGSTGAEEKQSIDCVLINKDNADKYNNFVMNE